MCPDKPDVDHFYLKKNQGYQSVLISLNVKYYPIVPDIIG